MADKTSGGAQWNHSLLHYASLVNHYEQMIEQTRADEARYRELLVAARQGVELAKQLAFVESIYPGRKERDPVPAVHVQEERNESPYLQKNRRAMNAAPALPSISSAPRLSATAGSSAEKSGPHRRSAAGVRPEADEQARASTSSTGSVPHPQALPAVAARRRRGSSMPPRSPRNPGPDQAVLFAAAGQGPDDIGDTPARPGKPKRNSEPLPTPRRPKPRIISSSQIMTVGRPPDAKPGKRTRSKSASPTVRKIPADPGDSKT